MMANKVAGVIMGGVLMIAAPVLVLTLGLGIFWGFVLAVIGYYAFQDGLSSDEENKEIDR